VEDTCLRKTELLEVKMHDLESGLGKRVYRWDHVAMYVGHLLFLIGGSYLLPIASWILIL